MFLLKPLSSSFFVSRYLMGENCFPPSLNLKKETALSFKSDRTQTLSPSGKKIYIMTDVIGGEGDIAFARKISSYFQEVFSVPKNDIRILLNPHPSMGFQEADLIVLGPAISFLHKDKNGDRQRLQYARPDTPIIALHEYGDPPVTYAEGISANYLGLNEKEKGILLSEDLLEWASVERTEQERLEQLQFVPLSFQEMILGKAYSPEAIQSFMKKGKFYFGYAHSRSLKTEFIQAVILMNKEIDDKRDLYFYFMGNDVLELDSDTEAWLEEIGFDKKRIKIMNARLPTEYVNAMHKASEAETISTGDQSMSEALSVGKIPAYEVYFFKKRFYEDFSKLMSATLPAGISDFYERQNTMPFVYKFNIEKLSKFFVALKQNSTEKSKFFQTIKEKHNFFSRFEEILSRAYFEISKKPLKRIKISS